MNDTLKLRLKDEQGLIRDRLADRVLTPFRLREITRKGDQFELQGATLNNDALKTLANRLKVQPALFETAKDEAWHTIQKGLNSALGNTEAVAKVDTKTGECLDIVSHRGEEKSQSINYDPMFNALNTALGLTEHEYDLIGVNLNKYDEAVINLRRLGSNIDVFQDGTDHWDTGCSFEFTVNGQKTAPFFERLICSNGMVAMEKGASVYTRVSKFNTDRLVNSGIRALRGDTGEKYIQEGCDRLRRVNISVRELLHMRDTLDSDNIHQNRLCRTLFNTDHIVKAYGEGVLERRKKWLSTADSNINAYDAFNHCTWIDSHPVEADVSDGQRKVFRKIAQDMFFAPALDLNDLAPNPFR